MQWHRRVPEDRLSPHHGRVAHHAEAEGVMAGSRGVEPTPAGRKAQDDNQGGTFDRHPATLIVTAIANAHSYRSNNGSGDRPGPGQCRLEDATTRAKAPADTAGAGLISHDPGERPITPPPGTGCEKFLLLSSMVERLEVGRTGKVTGNGQKFGDGQAPTSLLRVPRNPLACCRFEAGDGRTPKL